MTSGPSTETTPLLHDDEPIQTKPPLSRFTIALILLLQLAEHLPTQVLYPFMPDLVANLDITHGDASKVSFYMGLERLLFFSTKACTTLFWNRTSDMLGRKPILLIGLVGAALSLFGTGVAKALWWLIMSRCLGGAFNGNAGIVNSVMAETAVDSDQLAELYSYMPAAFAATGLFGPLIGGSLAHPAKQFPTLFGSNEFLKKYPFFLPCAVTASFILFVCAVSVAYLRETHKNPITLRQWLGRTAKKEPADQNNEITAEQGPLQEDIPESERPYPLWDILRMPQVLLVALNVACLCISQASLNTFQPLQLSLAVEDGGIGFDPALVGKILSAFGLLNGTLQLFFFAKINSYLKPKWFFISGTAAGIPMIASFPISNYLARRGETGTALWIVIAVQTLAKVGINMSSGALFIVVAAAAPNKASLGSTNGICSTVGSFMRAFGPAVTNTIFALSLKQHVLGGNLVYIFLLVTTSITLFTASLLPEHLWTKKKK